MNGRFAHLRDKNKSFYSNNIANIKQFLKNVVIECLILCGTNFVTIYVNLNSAGFILQFTKRCLSHNTLRGAAGGAVLLAELLAAKGYLE